MNEPRPLVNVDGWLTDDPDELRQYLAAPGDWTYAKQLGVDARSWKTLSVAAVGGACVALGLRDGVGHLDWGYLIVGLGVWAWYGRALQAVVRGRQNVRLLEASVRFDQRHPMIAQLATGVFVGKDGRTLGQAVLVQWAVEKTRCADGTHHVLIAYDSAAQFSQVVGIRPR